MRKHFPAPIWLPCLLGLAMIGAPAGGETIGYSHALGEIYRLVLDPGSGGDVPWQVVASTELGGLSGGLALSADGRLFGTSYWWPNDDRLAVIDPSTGGFEFAGPIATALWTDLTFDDQQRLWMVNALGLHRVDVSDAMVTPVATDATHLQAIGFHAGKLFGITASASFDSFWLVEIDVDTGAGSPIVELQGFVHESCFSESPVSMAFDQAGGLWVVVSEAVGTCIIPFFRTSYAYYPNPSNGIPDPRRSLAPGAPEFLPGLEVVSAPLPVVEVPALSTIGLVFLTALMLLGALTRLARARG